MVSSTLTTSEVMDLCRSYADMGAALTEQVDSALEMDLNDANFNPNAFDDVGGFLQMLQYVMECAGADTSTVDEALENLYEYMEELE
jgi:hypothetical protein